MMRNASVNVTAVLLLCGNMALAGPTLGYEGSLSGDGLETQGKWAGSVLSWEISREGSAWLYSYTLTVPDVQGAPDISHLTIEVSSSFESSNIWGIEFDGIVQEPALYGQGGQGNSDPGIPGALWGIKFDVANGVDTQELSISFYSNRDPMWGDFYAKGGQSAVWNSQFGENYYYYALSPAIAGKVMVPDTTVSYDPPVIVPAPGAILLGSIGVGLVGWMKRRRAL